MVSHILFNYTSPLTQIAVVKLDSVSVQSMAAVALALFSSHNVNGASRGMYYVTCLGRWGGQGLYWLVSKVRQPNEGAGAALIMAQNPEQAVTPFRESRSINS